MGDTEVIDRLLDRDVLVPVLITGGIVICVLFSTLSKMVRSVARERTRREIAAYIAEGSMTPEQGERLMRSGGNREA